MNDKISLKEVVGGVARLQVRVAEAEVIAILSEDTWCARFGSGNSDASFRELLLANQSRIAAAVIRRAAPIPLGKVVSRPQDFI